MLRQREQPVHLLILQLSKKVLIFSKFLFLPTPIYAAMKFRYQIKDRLNLLAIIVSFLLIFLTLTALLQGLSIRNNYLAISLIERIITNHLEIQKYQKDFYLQDAVSLSFFETKQSTNLQKLDSIQNNTQILMDQLSAMNVIQRIKKERVLTDLRQDLSTVVLHFDQLVQVVNQKGFKDFGLEGVMRQRIHSVEQSLDESPNANFKILMLTLRRHEKDFLLRNDKSYIDKFDAVTSSFIAIVSGGTAMENDIKNNLLAYQQSFHSLAELQNTLNRNSNNSLIYQLDTENQLLGRHLYDLHTDIKNGALNQITKSINIIAIIAILLFTLILFIIFRVSKYINKSINHLKEYITQLGNGELPAQISNQNDDEIGDMVNSVNVLTQNLKNTKEFAIEVGNGNLETEVNVFNNQGDLGSSLVEMRNRLLKVSKERVLFEIENKQRNWVNEGIARFSEILRLNHQTTEDIAYQLLSNLIDYLDANQGAIYLIADKVDEDDPLTLELVSAIAYGRKKHIKDRIAVGEDIIGRCAYELKTIYMTDVPQDFIKITSGLGTANPKAVLVVPFVLHDEIFGVLELASFKNFEQYHIDFAERIAVNIATTISHLKINKNTERLLHQAQVQSEEIASQEEELRQNMEEMQATQEESTRREAEIAQSLAVYNALIPTMKLDLRGVILDINNPLEGLLETKHESLVGKMFTTLFLSNENKEGNASYWDEIVEGKKSIKTLTFSYINVLSNLKAKFVMQSAEMGMDDKVFVLFTHHQTNQHKDSDEIFHCNLNLSTAKSLN